MGGLEGQEERRVAGGRRNGGLRRTPDSRPGHTSPTEIQQPKALYHSYLFSNKSDRRSVAPAGCDLAGAGDDPTWPVHFDSLVKLIRRGDGREMFYNSCYESTRFTESVSGPGGRFTTFRAKRSKGTSAGGAGRLLL